MGVAVGSALVILMLSGCEGDSKVGIGGRGEEAAESAPPARSARAFCAVHDKHKKRYLAAFDSANASIDGGDMLTGVLQAGVALGDLTTMWKELAEVAPERIRVDTEVVAAGWEKQADLADDLIEHPLKGLSSALLGSFKLTGPLQRIDRFVRNKCDAGR
jgi:hypothetical protein